MTQYSKQEIHLAIVKTIKRLHLKEDIYDTVWHLVISVFGLHKTDCNIKELINAGWDEKATVIKELTILRQREKEAGFSQHKVQKIDVNLLGILPSFFEIMLLFLEGKEFHISELKKVNHDNM